MANIIPTWGKQIWSGRLIGTTPTQLEPKQVAFGTGDPAGTRLTAAVTDKALFGEVVVNGAQTARVVGTPTQQTVTNTLDTYQVIATITCNLGGGLALTEAGLFDTTTFPAQTTIATQGVLSGTGTGATTTITSATGFPTASTDYQIESEILTSTLSGTTLTITARGANGSTAVAHASGRFITVASQTGTGTGGTMAAKADYAVVNLAQNDTLQLTAKVQFT